MIDMNYGERSRRCGYRIGDGALHRSRRNVLTDGASPYEVQTICAHARPVIRFTQLILELTRSSMMHIVELAHELGAKVLRHAQLQLRSAVE